jgi:hypothetical protein
MRTSAWDYVVIVLTAVIFATAAAVREQSAGAAAGGAFVGFILGALFCTFVRLVAMPLQREVERLQDRVAELERRSGGAGPAAS